jgi:argininosuccinate lyase
MSVVAKTAASGGSALHPEVLAFSSSLEADRSLVREDLVGSLAHVKMLAQTGILPPEVAVALHGGLTKLWREHEQKTLALPEEEDVHMAIEVLLHERLGEPAKLLHSARSRNDQVATVLKLHVRDQAKTAALGLLSLIETLIARAKTDGDILLPAYTHRQRAQPITLAYWLLGYAEMLRRDVGLLRFVLDELDASPLGVGAIAGSSLPIDRTITRDALGFGRTTESGLDTVGDRDFALNFTYAAARTLLHTSRLSTDLVDFTTAEFGFAKLDGAIACGSSMMPQKKNPDVFELTRGKTGQAVGNLMALLVTLKGLPGGYNRDQQEDRGPILETGPLLRSVASILSLALDRVSFDRERCLAALTSDATQATDVAEALVKTGIPFRTAYMAAGALVRAAQEAKIPLAKVDAELARKADPLFEKVPAAVLEVLRVEGSVGRKSSQGSTGPAAVAAHTESLVSFVREARTALALVPSLPELFGRLSEPLS